MENDKLKINKINHFEVDGNAEKPVWKNAQEITLFDAVTGKGIGKNKTKGKMMWSDVGLFVLWQVEDEHIRGTYKNDDDPIYNEEVVEIFIAKGEKIPKEYFEFQFSPLSVKFDAKIDNPTGNRHDKGFNVNVGWNCDGLRFSQNIISVRHPGLDPGSIPFFGTWTTEAFIPWKSIGIENIKSGDILRVNLFRIDGYPKQSSFQAWQPTLQDPPNFHVPEKFGFIRLSL